eukprot:SAG31_NODE_3748_length_3926_cov_5.734779_1_plen_83_part_00
MLRAPVETQWMLRAPVVASSMAGGLPLWLAAQLLAASLADTLLVVCDLLCLLCSCAPEKLAREHLRFSDSRRSLTPSYVYCI